MNAELKKRLALYGELIIDGALCKHEPEPESEPAAEEVPKPRQTRKEKDGE